MTFNFPSAVQTALSIVVVVIPLLKFALMLNPVCTAAETGVTFVVMSVRNAIRRRAEQASGSEEGVAASETNSLLGASNHSSHNVSQALLGPAASSTVRVISRLCVTLAVVGVAAAMPFFGLVTSLTGSMLSLLVCAVFPSSCYLKLLWHKASWLERVVNAVIVVVASFLAVSGTLAATRALAHAA